MILAVNLNEFSIITIVLGLVLLIMILVYIGISSGKEETNE
jgi:hypothetical protein